MKSYEEIMKMVTAGTLKKSHTVKASTYIRLGDTKTEEYDGKYGKGFKVYEHMIGGSNLGGKFSKSWLTYYIYA